MICMFRNMNLKLDKSDFRNVVVSHKALIEADMRTEKEIFKT